ncbi:MAG: acyl-CoA-binding protein [Acidimicrobiia bacterium]|nr:acyl-CoA-binding protein [Acidimicrobiia bacterium]RZV41682.1 MAG: acyl-CoA-binding protein [Acidimicrobiia bacterium]
MSDLADRFANAAAESKSLPERPGNDDMLKLYALYKQGSLGDVAGDRPGMMDFVGRAKYDAWADVAGMSQDDAMTAYIELVESLRAG